VDSYAGDKPSTALHRGNDWYFADFLDGIGTSSFPIWDNIDQIDFIARVDFLRSAARGKQVWLSELQGGRSVDGFTIHRSPTAAHHQRWTWSAIAGGAKSILFWCWRDEVLGHESGGFGITGADGRNEERIAGLRKISRLLDTHADFLQSYSPSPGEIGVFFSPQTYYLSWCEDGNSRRIMQAVQGVARALIRSGIPYRIIEENHLAELDQVRVLFMPHTLVLEKNQADIICSFVRAGGTLITESECGAFGANGLYRYPPERFLSRLADLREQGRRDLSGDTVSFELELPIGRRSYEVPATQWCSPFEDGNVAQIVQVCSGRVVALGLYTAEAYYEGQRFKDRRYIAAGADYERLVLDIAASAGVFAPVTVAGVDGGVVTDSVQTGQSNGIPIVCVTSDAAAELLSIRMVDPVFAEAFRDGAVEIISGVRLTCNSARSTAGITVAIEVPQNPWGVSILRPARSSSPPPCNGDARRRR